MATPRRFGTESSKTRAVLLDAAEVLMRENGYAAVTVRGIASKAGLKFQIVHYYFRTLDDLLLELLRNLSRRYQERFEKVLTSKQPLRAMWAIIRDPADLALTSQFLALATHRTEIRAEIALCDERLRSMQIQILSQALESHKDKLGNLPPIVLSVLMSSVARYVQSESTLGISLGHAETLAIVESYLNQLEP